MKINESILNETYFRANRENWNERVEHHVGAKYYDVQGFLSGRSTLGPVELKSLGDVTGMRILHLQCHFGLDTLSLSRMGGIVTGVDFSDTAIQKAREIAEVAGLSAEFHCANV
ncbi:MAG: class I SAM-dependent methyltransferase [Candidatus Poribacteria bacterium]|nr:class I SAM-dependent methyltransferase [Candidatus Poribacteria bacterium]